MTWSKHINKNSTKSLMRNQAEEGNAMYFPYPGENMQDSLRRTQMGLNGRIFPYKIGQGREKL